MSNSTIGQFDISVTQMDERSKLPFDPWVVIQLKRWGKADEDGAPTISAHLMSESEIDEHVAALKADLDAVSSRAKRALRAARADSLKLVQQRTGKSDAS